MKYIKLFEGFYFEEMRKVKSQAESAIKKLNKQFEREAKEILSQFEDEFNYHFEIEDCYPDNDEFVYGISMSRFKKEDYDDIFKTLENIYQITKSKELSIDFKISHKNKIHRYDGNIEEEWQSDTNQTIEDFKKRNLRGIKEAEESKNRTITNRKLEIYITDSHQYIVKGELKKK